MTSTQTLWHNDITVDGALYPTRNHAPDFHGTSDDCFALTADQIDYIRAIHEAGHAITALTAAAHLHHAEIATESTTTEHGGATHACGLGNGHAYAIYTAAGERAADRWLRETNLWTPERAVAVEVGARSDRASFLNLNKHVGYGNKQIDYTTVHDLADETLNHHWDAVTRVADALTQHHYLTGNTVARIADMTNGFNLNCSA